MLARPVLADRAERHPAERVARRQVVQCQIEVPGDEEDGHDGETVGRGIELVQRKSLSRSPYQSRNPETAESRAKAPVGPRSASGLR
jgi:hypothetical protein